MPYTAKMAVDEQSSQDTTLIDDDLVAALGFEPVTTIETDESNGESANGDAESNDDVSIIDDVSVVDDAPEAVADAALTDDVSFEERGSFFDLDSADAKTVIEEAADDVPDVDVVDVEDVAVEDLVDDEPLADEPLVDDAEAAAEVLEVAEEVEVSDDVDLDAAALDLVDDDVVGESDLDSVPSIADPELDGDATAPVGLIDLDTHEDDTHEDDTHEGFAIEGDVALDDLEAPTSDEVADEVIDLDTVDLSDEVPIADAEVHELADADSVFADTPSADSTPLLDPPSFDDPIGHPATETVDQVGSGLLDLDAGDPAVAKETVGTAAVATAATATATKGRRRLRARKSRRVIRHIDPWSVLTFSVLFHMVVFAALLLSSVIVWNAAIASGMVENVESFIQELGDYETFEINADVMFRAAIVIAGMLTLASSVLVVLLTVVFNLISDLVGGIRVTVIEEETVRVPIDKKRTKARNE